MELPQLSKSCENENHAGIHVFTQPRTHTVCVCVSLSVCECVDKKVQQKQTETIT